MRLSYRNKTILILVGLRSDVPQASPMTRPCSRICSTDENKVAAVAAAAAAAAGVPLAHLGRRGQPERRRSNRKESAGTRPCCQVSSTR